MTLDALHEDLHLLALHYHWAEADILRLTSSKRRRYLRRLARHIGESEHEEMA
jgi:hypothetical protein